jgi:hypothetical protein
MASIYSMIRYKICTIVGVKNNTNKVVLLKEETPLDFIHTFFFYVGHAGKYILTKLVSYIIDVKMNL